MQPCCPQDKPTIPAFRPTAPWGLLSFSFAERESGPMDYRNLRSGRGATTPSLSPPSPPRPSPHFPGPHLAVRLFAIPAARRVRCRAMPRLCRPASPLLPPPEVRCPADGWGPPPPPVRMGGCVRTAVSAVVCQLAAQLAAGKHGHAEPHEVRQRARGGPEPAAGPPAHTARSSPDADAADLQWSEAEYICTTERTHPAPPPRRWCRREDGLRTPPPWRATRQGSASCIP
jgi:hypothetical protein